jgi:glycerophosphoryl diester phosphodiesterase
VNIELKYDVPDKRALAWEVARVIKASRAEVLASSFDPRILGWLAMQASVRRAWLVNATQRNIALAIRVLARRVALHAVHLERRLASPARVRMLKARGLRVGVWTINDPIEARGCRSIGVDWLVTDVPGMLRVSLGDEPRS